MIPSRAGFRQNEATLLEGNSKRALVSRHFRYSGRLVFV